MRMIRLGRKKHDTFSIDDRLLLHDLFSVKDQLDDVRRKFDYVTEPEMVSSCIYQMHALQERYAFLLSQVRERELTLADKRRFLREEAQQAQR